MAFQKTFVTSSGVSCDYHSIGPFRWDPHNKEASAQVDLYVSQALAEAGATPQIPAFGKFRLYGAKFDEYVSKSALTSSAFDVVAILYSAIAWSCDENHTTGETNGLAHLICDGGKDFYHDATDV